MKNLVNQTRWTLGGVVFKIVFCSNAPWSWVGRERESCLAGLPFLSPAHPIPFSICMRRAQQPSKFPRWLQERRSTRRSRDLERRRREDRRRASRNLACPKNWNVIQSHDGLPTTTSTSNKTKEGEAWGRRSGEEIRKMKLGGETIEIRKWS